jgi:hypothetical protein
MRPQKYLVILLFLLTRRKYNKIDNDCHLLLCI